MPPPLAAFWHWLLARRWRAATLYLLTLGIFAYALSAPVAWYINEGLNVQGKDTGVTSVLLALVVVALHAIFLLPIYRPGDGRSRGLGGSIVVGSLLIGVMLGLLVLAIGQLIYSYGGYDPGVRGAWIGVGTAVFVGWIAGFFLVTAFVRTGRRENVLTRLSARLFVGTILEAAAIIPMDAMVRRKEDCVCTTGTYMALVGCAVIGVFTLGPAVILPLLARRRRRWYAGQCEVCGYDMTRTPKAERCPECGTGWRARAPG
ncbi:MAG: hypothetical protein IPM33_09230 [Phycisphaerales bacterium]|nr:hypothetical protein [Phycisphaerales bacterium]